MGNPYRRAFLLKGLEYDDFETYTLKYLNEIFPEYLFDVIFNLLNDLGTALINSQRPGGKQIKSIWKKRDKRKKEQIMRLPDGTIVEME